ncbi:MAG: hypothetical protein DI539_26460 [Flavobacterium psychrophilum]|jgi:hypothetical protein|nr:MAG: hypothetical protein DI539_26460 [Flavobacterium psychrophilum]
MNSEEAIIRSSGENVIEWIKEHRNDLIHRLSDTSFLKEYLLTEFQIKEISAIKLKFIKRALTELASASVDLSHYAALILETRKKGSLSISRSTEHFFHKDIERTIKNYL